MTRSLLKVSLACLCALFVAGARPSAQTPVERAADSPASSYPFKLDAYGKIRCDDLLARLDHLAVVLSNERDAEAHVFVYDGRVKVSHRLRDHMDFTKAYVTGQRNIEARRVHVHDAGQREEFAVEIFIVQKGSSPPKPTPTVDAPDDPRAARKFDEGYFGFDPEAKGRPVHRQDAEVTCSSEPSLNLAGYAKALRAEPDSKAHVVVYGGRGRRLSESNTVSRLIRHRLFTVENISHRRITVVYGGTRGEPFVELWIVPGGARAPSERRQ